MFIDEMNYDTCWELWNAIQSNPIITARKMFPKRQPHYVKVTKRIGQYTANKGTALGITQGGDLGNTSRASEERKNRRDMYIKIAADIWTSIPAWGLAFNINFLEEN
jgi:hypothetical protein